MDKFVTLLHNTRIEQKSQAAQHTATHTYTAAHTEITSCTAHTNAASAQHTHTLHIVTQQFTRKPNTHTHTHAVSHNFTNHNSTIKQLNKHKQVTTEQGSRNPQVCNQPPQDAICCCQLLKSRSVAAMSNPSSREPSASPRSAAANSQVKPRSAAK